MYQSYQTANGHQPHQPVQGDQAQLPINDLELKVKLRTDKYVYLNWNPGRHDWDDYPYKLQYLKLPIQIGVTQPVQIHANLFYTTKELKIPRDEDRGTVQLDPGKGYRFILSAKKKNRPNDVLYGVTDVQMACEPCRETIRDILQSQDFLQNFCISVDSCHKLHQSIAGRFRVERKDYKDILMYADGTRKRITEELLQHISDKCQDDDKIQVCQLLQVVKEHGPTKIKTELFQWHTGRPDGPGECQVCTREYFG